MLKLAENQLFLVEISINLKNLDTSIDKDSFIWYNMVIKIKLTKANIK